jgi:ribosome-binding protein aMBF1 (putative translation factor)
MAKRQKTKWQTTIYKTLHRKLKISEAVNIRTENTMAKRQTTIYKTLHRKLKIKQHEHN